MLKNIQDLEQITVRKVGHMTTLEIAQRLTIRCGTLFPEPICTRVYIYAVHTVMVCALQVHVVQLHSEMTYWKSAQMLLLDIPSLRRGVKPALHATSALAC